MTAPRTQVLMDWLTGLGWDTTQETGYPLFPPPVLESPDRSVWLTIQGGPGFMTDEGSVDAWTAQVRLRGPSDDPFEAEAMAAKLDQMILFAQFPVAVDGASIRNAHRLGSPPAPLPVDLNDLRHEFTCTYVIVTGA